MSGPAFWLKTKDEAVDRRCFGQTIYMSVSSPIFKLLLPI